MLKAPSIPPAEPTRLTPEQALETARLAAVGGVAGELVHELNNPLFAILGLVEMLVRDAEPGSKDAYRLGLVQDTALELRGLVRSFGEFARGTGHTVADAADAVARAVALTGRTSATKDVTIAVEATGGPLPVHGGAQLVAVVTDLITKARHALPCGGTVVISLAREGRTAVLHVAATGDQVAPLVLDTGVGVAIDAAAVQALGGSLAHGPGSELSVRLPLSDEESAS